MRPSAPVKSGMPGGKLDLPLHCRDELTEQERPLYVEAKMGGIVLIFQMGWWGEMGGPKQKGVVQYSTCLSLGEEDKQEKTGKQYGIEENLEREE